MSCAARRGLRGRHAQFPRASRRSRLACATCDALGHRHDPHARRLPHRVAAQAVAARDKQRQADGAASTGPSPAPQRGGIVTLNCYDPEGHLLDYRRVEELATAHPHLAAHRLLLQPRRGRNGGGPDEGPHPAAAEAADLDLTLPRFLQVSSPRRNGKSAGAIRVSFGIASNFADAWRFLQFASTLRDQTRLTIGEATFDIESCRVIRDGS